MAETHIRMSYTILAPSMIPIYPKGLNSLKIDHFAIFTVVKAIKLSNYERASHISCSVRRRIIYNDDEEEEEENGYNEEITMLEVYSQSARREVLIFHALVDDQQVEVLIFKGFSQLFLEFITRVYQWSLSMEFITALHGITLFDGSSDVP